MKTTSGAVSTICYATKEYALARLGQLQNEGTIAFWALVEHPAYVTATGEERKEHLHIYLEAGNTRLNLEALSKYLEQAIPNEALPRRCKPWRRSAVADWLPYSAHDSEYLAFKRLEKPYYDIPLTDFETSDKATLSEIWAELPRDKWKSDIRRLMEAVEQGLSWAEYADINRIPLAMLGTTMRAYQALWGEREAYLQRRMVGLQEEREPQEPEQLRIWTTTPPKDAPF